MKLLLIIVGTIISFALVANLSPNPNNAVTLIFAGVACLFYFLPTFIAFQNKHQNKTAITLLNVLLGWTILGWIASIIWANTKKATA